MQRKYKMKKAWKKAKLVYYFIKIRRNETKQQEEEQDD